ncbi:MAG: YbhB/YbcL family Raf kinase inhibitor-like protein, partial [Chloroflexota bacterium]
LPATSTSVPPTPTALLSPAFTPTSTAVPTTPTPLPPMVLSSPAFAAEGHIPLRHAQQPFEVPFGEGKFVCPGAPAGKENLSPPLEWANVPPEAKSLALVMVDDLHYAYPDAPEGAFFPHWLVYNIPPTASGLPEGVTANPTLPDGSLQGVNAYPPPFDQGYGGPCPPKGEEHLYLFTLYALDTTLALPPAADYEAVVAALEGHILTQAELRGYYTGQ